MLTDAEPMNPMNHGGAGFEEAMARIVALIKQPPPWAERVIGGAAAGIFAVGVISASFIGRGDDGAADPAKTTSPPAAVSLESRPSALQSSSPVSSWTTRRSAPTRGKAVGKQSGAKRSATPTTS